MTACIKSRKTKWKEYFTFICTNFKIKSTTMTKKAYNLKLSAIQPLLTDHINLTETETEWQLWFHIIQESKKQKSIVLQNHSKKTYTDSMIIEFNELIQSLIIDWSTKSENNKQIRSKSYTTVDNFISAKINRKTENTNKSIQKNIQKFNHKLKFQNSEIAKKMYRS